MTSKQQAHALRNHWKTRWKEDSSLGPYRGNIHRDSAQLKAVADDIGYSETIELIDFYFRVRAKPDFMWFLYNYDKLQKELDREAEDKTHRETLREATRRRMEELRGGQGSA